MVPHVQVLAAAATSQAFALNPPVKLFWVSRRRCGPRQSGSFHVPIFSEFSLKHDSREGAIT
jgi:hypothetical protein